MYPQLLFAIFICVIIKPEVFYAKTNKPLWNETYTDKLRKDLFKNYDRAARPSEHYNKTTVRFGLAMTHIEVLEATSIVNVYGWARLVWYDEKLQWNESDYGDINVLRVPSHEVWKPDIFLYNSAVSTPIFWSSALVLIYPNGEILWVPPTMFAALCDLDFRYWPFDVQHCHLTFASWTSGGETIDLQLYNNKPTIDLSDLLTNNNQWQILETSAIINNKSYPCCKEIYPEITYNITVARRSPAYAKVIITPAFVIMISTLLSFWVTPFGNGKIYVTGSTILLICLFLFYFAQKLPSLGDHTPLIISFYSHCLYVVSFAMIEGIIVILIVNASYTSPVPWKIKKYFTGRLGSMLGFKDCSKEVNLQLSSTAEEMRDHQFSESNENTNERSHSIPTCSKVDLQLEWYSFALAVDKLTFILYCLLFFIMCLAHSL